MSWKPPPPVLADRAAGAVLASACGDALGAGYEFGPPLGDDVEVAIVGGGTFGWAAGEWTDDTQMALAILAPLAAGVPDPVPAIEAGFRAWNARDPADVGIRGSCCRRPGRWPTPLAPRATAIHLLGRHLWTREWRRSASLLTSASPTF